MADVETLGSMLGERAQRHGRKEAILFEGRSLSFRDLDEQACKVANGLTGLGIEPGDRVALMLPNTPEFATCFFGIQKLGAVAVPFNTLYRGREILHILNDSGARALIALTHFAPLIDELREDAPRLEHVILTGQRSVIFVTPESTAGLQLVLAAGPDRSVDTLYRRMGDVLTETLRALGVDAGYKHRGGLRVRGRRIGLVTVSGIENLHLVSAICFLGPLHTEDFFRVIWVPPEVKDKILEPSTSVEEMTGRRPSATEFREALLSRLRETFGVDIEEGGLLRDERLGYEKARTLSRSRS